MPIIRKILHVGASKAVSLPKSWIDCAEQEAGKRIVAMALEVDEIITIQPVFEKKDSSARKTQEPQV